MSWVWLAAVPRANINTPDNVLHVLGLARWEDRGEQILVLGHCPALAVGCSDHGPASWLSPGPFHSPETGLAVCQATLSKEVGPLMPDMHDS